MLNRIVLFAICLTLSNNKAKSDSNVTINSFDPDFGIFIGELPSHSDSDIKGRVYVVNETALQILNFSYDGKAPDLYFWLDRSESPTRDGVKIPSFEYGITPLGPYDNVERVVLILPGLHKITSFKTFSLFSYNLERNFGTIPIPENLVVPKPQFLSNELRGSRYSVSSGPILIVDRRTIKIFGFTFDADKAPDGYFFVGRGPNVVHDAGVKVPIRGRDTSELITAMNERYRGGKDIILDLPEDYDINHIDWLSIYCYKFRVDFGHVPVSNISQRIPPFIPLQKGFDNLEKINGWPGISLLGTEDRLSFTFQLGPPGGKKGYQSMARARPAQYVWYVNGYLADIFLKRGITYTFIVEGGDDKSTAFYNPLYFSDDPFGGFAKLSADEKQQVKIFAGQNPNQTVGRLCLWSQESPEDDPDQYSSFTDYRKTLKLKCSDSSHPAKFQFAPSKNTPDTLFYQSYSTYNMGWKIHVVDELPHDVADFKEQPYQYDLWLQHQNLLESPKGSFSKAAIQFVNTLLIVVILIASFLISDL